MVIVGPATQVVQELLGDSAQPTRPVRHAEVSPRLVRDMFLQNNPDQTMGTVAGLGPRPPSSATLWTGWTARLGHVRKGPA